MNIEIKRLNDSVPMPTYATDGSAAVDLTFQGMRYVKLKNNDTRAFIATGLSVWIKDPDVVGLVFNRSSLPISLENAVGVIDSDYQGEVLIRPDTRLIPPGLGKIAQLIFMPIIRPTFIEVKEFSEVTKRGSGAFGHTGK